MSEAVKITEAKITEKAVVNELADDAYMFVSQKEELGDGAAAEVLRRAPLAAVAEKVTGPLAEKLANLSIAEDVESLITNDNYTNKTHYAVRNNGTYHYHAWNKNYNFIADVTGLKRIYIHAISAYINWLFFADAPSNAVGQTVLAYGGSYAGYTYLNEADTLEAAEHEYEIEVPEGAGYIVVDFGYTTPTDLAVAKFMGTYTLKDYQKKIVGGNENEVLHRDGGGNLSFSPVGNLYRVPENAIGPDELNLNWEDIAVKATKVLSGVETYTSGLRIQTALTSCESAVYEYHLVPGVYFFNAISYPRNADLIQNITNGESLSYVNTFVGWTENRKDSTFFTNKIGKSLGTDDFELGTGMAYGVLRALAANGIITIPVNADISTNYKPAIFETAKDIYIYWCSAVPTGTQKYVEGPSGTGRVFKIAALPEYGTDGYTAATTNSILKLLKYDNSWNGFTASYKKNDDIIQCGFYSREDAKLAAAMARLSRDIDTNALIIGDSITYAASNAGLQNAWRKYISAKGKIYEYCIAVSGTTMTYGYAFDFNGNAPDQDGYDVEMTGVRGIKSLINGSLSGTSAFATGLSFSLIDYAIIALGTNDFGNDAALGSVDTIGDDGTFYGAAYQLYHYLHDDLRIPYVVFICPFKRQNWNVENSAATPYTIYDMAHALAELSLIEPDMYVFDCLDRWYLDYDNADIKARSFIDTVHIRPYAHHMFTIDLVKYLKDIIAVRGTRHYDGEIVMAPSDGMDETTGEQ